MSRRIACWILVFLVLAWFGPLALAEQPVAKTEKPAVESEQPAAKNEQPAAKEEAKKPKDAEKPKEEKPAAKDAEKPKEEKPAAKDAKPVVKDAAETPPTHTVKKGPIKVTIQLDGLFEAQNAREIFVKPEEWKVLTVETAVAHGTNVREGDVLLTLETEKLDQAISDLRTELKLSGISIRQGEDQIRAMQQIEPIDLESSRRAAQISEEDRKYFLDIEMPFAIKATDFLLKVSKMTLEYDQEELRQLEKMYKADDITEETEQIVLKRARDTVERSKFNLETSQLYHDQALKYSIPRYEDRIKESAQRKILEWEKNKISIPVALEKQRLEMERLRLQRERLDERLKKMLADRELMSVKSPIDGIVYYGKCVRGKFSDSIALADNLRPNGVIMPNQVVMTVVQPRPMYLRASVPEDQLHWLRPGLKGLATPEAYPDVKLSATIDDLGEIPTAPDSFDARLNVELNRKAKRLMPGMGCKVRFVPYLKKNAITVPPKAVHADELDDQKFFVYLVAKDGKPKKQPVTLGKKTDKLVEILKGLSEGDKVLLEAPKEQK